VLEFAILGLLHEEPMHGYELRKRLCDMLGTLRTFSYGSLYPTLRRLLKSGLIVEDAPPADPNPVDERGTRSWGKRAKRVYKLTAEGKERFAEMLADTGPQAYDDDGFGVHMAFFSRTPAEIRMRILEGRRRRVEERREGLRSSMARAGEQIDRYTRELHRLGLEHSEREVRWLNELIATEQREQKERQEGSP
jgi:DNA-binding PadR family transcriptional regulator